MKRVLTLADEYALWNDPVLITGETGTGKELIARRIHEKSHRKAAPLVVVNCGAVPIDLFEREFFGHKNGAYTGAHTSEPGYVEHADGGTLFLDEVADLPLALQAKLLRLIEYSSYYRLGDPAERRANIRIVAASNVKLPERVVERTFRADLYYRLRVVDIEIPPLRVRPDDIIPIYELFLSSVLGRGIRAVDFLLPAEIDDLLRAPLLGNARDIMHLVRKKLVSGASPGHTCEEPRVEASARRTHRPKRHELLALMERYDGNKAKLARHWGIARSTLYRWLADTLC